MIKVFCHGHLVPVRKLVGGYALCLGCGARIRVVW